MNEKVILRYSFRIPLLHNRGQPPGCSNNARQTRKERRQAYEREEDTENIFCN